MAVSVNKLQEYFNSKGIEQPSGVLNGTGPQVPTISKDKKVPKISDEKLENYFNNRTKDIKLEIPKNTIDLGEQPDGSKKYTFNKDDPNSMYKDKQLISNARAYYFERDGLQFDNDTELVDYYISDRTWKQANSLSIGKELIYATADATSVDQKRRLQYLTNYWTNLPNFWQDGGRGFFSGIVSNFSKGLIDPTNLIGPGVGKFVTTAVAKKGGKYVLSKAVASGVATQTGIDAAIGSSADAMIQKTEREIGIAERFDPIRNLKVAGLAGGASFVPGLPITYFSTKSQLSSKTLNKNYSSIKQQVFDYANPLKDFAYKLYGVKGNVDDFVKQSKKTDVILKEISKNPTDPLTRKLNNYYKEKPEDRGALVLTKKELGLLKKKRYKRKKIDFLELRDPGDYGYTNFRLLAASSTRAESAIKYKVVLPVVPDRSAMGKPTGLIVKAGYEDVNVKPYEKIIQPVDDLNLVNVFNNYIQAKRSQSLNAAGVKTTMKTADIRAAIKDFNALKGNERKVIRQAFEEHKQFTRTLLELQRRAGIISKKEMNTILKENPVYSPFYLRTKESAKLQIKKSEAVGRVPTDKPQKRFPTEITGREVEITGGTKGPARLKITGNDKEIRPLHESLVNYTFHAYSASEKNIAKLKFYDEIDEAITRGIIEKNQVVRRINSVGRINAIRKDIVKQLQKEADELGIKFDADSFKKGLEGEDSIKVAAFKDTIKISDGTIVDVVYNNGKLQMYEIMDPSFVEMFKSLGGVTNKYLRNIIYGNLSRGGLLGKLGTLSRVFPNLITHSPPFIAFNFIRDTLAGSINSAFGFNAYGFAPGLSTAKGLFGTFKAPKDMFDSAIKNVSSDAGFKKYYRGFKEAFSLNNNYLKALNSGMGFSSRKDSDRLVKQLTANIQNSKAPNKKAYLDSLNWLKSIGFYGADAAKAYSQLVNRIEYASRLAEFNLAKRVGVSDAVAAFAGREISTDFGMHGASAGLNAYNRMTMFFNAGLQGFYRGVVRRVGENPVKFASGVTATIVAPELLFWSLTSETPEYEALDDDIKLLNYVIPIYEDTKADNSHLRPDGTRRIKTFLLVPKPYDFGAFANIARGIMESIQEGAPEIAVNYAYHSIAKVFPGLTTPTLASPVIDLIRNKNYKDNEIIPYYKSVGTYRDQLVRTNTRFSSEKIAKGINDIYREVFATGQQDPFQGIVSPITIDYLLNGYFVGLAEYPLDVADAVVDWDEEAFGERPDRRLDESDITRSVPSLVTRRFFAEVPVKYSKDLSTLYDLKKTAEKTILSIESASNDLTQLLRNNMKVDIDKLSSDKLRSATRVSSMLSEALVAIKGLREKREIIKYSKIYTAEQKRTMIDNSIKLENELAYNILRDLKESADPYLMMGIFGNKTFKSYRDKNIKLKGFQKTVANYFK